MRHPVLSAHDEVADALRESARGLPDVESYCPNVHAYAYFVLHTRSNRIFGIAFGQRSLAYRLPQERIAEALAEGGSVCSEIGEDWVVLDPWRANGTAAPKWCKLAHDHAVAPAASNRKKNRVRP
ncbi:MAG: hypothetical protein ACT4PQ_02890 [Betaproteobacteria bacterium]